jgi:CII-binding regulator of phage lambda lysogenization HflD
MKVSNLINYSVSYYGLSKINRIFFYSSFEIENLYESFVSFWDLSGIEFKKYEIPTDYDFFDYTAAVYNAKFYQKEDENFSIFPKPTPFYKTKTAVLAGLIVLFSVLIAADIFMKYQTINKQNHQMLIFNKKISKNKREQNLFKSAILKYQKQINEIKEKNSALQKQISDISEKILFLKNIQNKRILSNQFADLVNELKKYHLKLLLFEKKDNHIELIIMSKFKDSSNAAKFMEDLYNLGYKNVSSTEIENNDGIYISKVSYDE